MPACIDQCLHHEPGEATPTEFFKGEDAVDFVPVRVKPAPCYRGKRPVDKGTEYAVFGGVGLLLVIVVPDFFDKGEFGKVSSRVRGVVVVGMNDNCFSGCYNWLGLMIVSIMVMHHPQRLCCYQIQTGS